MAPILGRVSDESVRRVPVALSIAGSDSGGGAGIQADLKAFARAGVHGTTAITAITVQNTVTVSAVQPIEPAIITGQIRAVAEDLGVDAVKIGMLGDVATIETVARALDELPAGTPIVHDPVMVAESGSRLLAARGGRRPAPADRRPRDGHHARTSPRRGCSPMTRSLTASSSCARCTPWDQRNVVVTGGHRETGTDLFFDGTTLTELPGERHPDGAAHGSGCTHSATLAARLALGDDPLAAARHARAVAAAAVRDGLRQLGAGAGPVDVFGLARQDRSPPNEPL